MALFEGEEMVNVTTPDGRVLTLPRSIVPASVLAQQQIGQGALAPPAPIAPGVAPLPTTMPLPEPGPESVTGGQLPTEASQLLPPAAEPIQNRPDFTLATIDQEALVRQREAQIKQQAAKEKAAAARATTPMGKVEAATQEVEKAISEQEQAGVTAAHMEAAGLAVQQAAFEKRAGEIQANNEKLRAENEADLAAQRKKLTEMEALKNKIANTKIDREIPWTNKLGAFLIGLGQTINKEKITTAQVIFEAIDRKVAAQMEDLDRQKQILGFTKDELAELRTTTQSRLALRSVLSAGESEKAAKDMEALAARLNSDKAKANGQMFAAQLRERAATFTTDAAKYQLEYEQKEKFQKQQIGLGYANLAETRRAHMAGEQLDREKMYLDQQRALAEANARGGEAAMKAQLEMMKDNETRGIRNIATKQPLLTKAGREAVEQADVLEQQAAQIEADKTKDQLAFSMSGGDEKVRQLREQASSLRGNALIANQVRASDPTQKGKITEQYAASQSMLQLIDEIKDLYDKAGRGYVLTTPEQEALQTKTTLLALKGKAAYQLGAWDKGAERITERLTPLNPTSGWDVGVLGAALNRERIKNPEGFKMRLDAIADGLTKDMDNVLSAGTNWDDKGQLFGRSTGPNLETPEAKASQALTQARTGTELSESAGKIGVAGKIARKIGYPFSSSATEEAERAQSVRYPKLSMEQEKPFDTLLQAYKKGSASAGDELVAKIVNSADSRPQLSVALLENLQQYAPDLYTKARAAMPSESKAAQKIGESEKSRIGAAQVPTNMLTTTVIGSINAEGKVLDIPGFNELVQRADRGDKDAARAILEIVRQSGANKTLPRGSVFREGR